MKHLNAEKYNLAWFKLAECVSRGEKERALGVYRLLSHSVGNDALAKQLFGDLLLCFDQKGDAIQQYKLAAQVYKKQGKSIESIAVYEHLITLNPNDKDDIFELCELYAQIQMPFKVVYHVSNLLGQGKLDFVIRLMGKYDQLFSDTESLQLNQELALACVRDKTRVRESVIEQLEKTLDMFVMGEDCLGVELGQAKTQDCQLSEFLLKIELEDESYHQHACEYLQKVK